MDEGRADGIGRRTILGGVAAVAAGAIACDREQAPASASAPALPPEAEALFRDLQPGTKVEQWTVVAVHPVRHGALPVVLAGADGQRFQVDVMAIDPGGPLGVANTKTLSLFVANRGDGDTPTDESQGLGAMALAAALGERETAGVEPPTLVTFAKRAEQHPDGAFAVPLG